MKTRFFLLLKVFILIGVSFSYGESPDNNKADSIVESLKNNKPPSTQNISDATSISLQLLERAQSTTETKLRSEIGQYVGRLEITNRLHPHPRYRARSCFFGLRDELVTDLELENGAVSTIADRILELFHPEDLRSVSERIRAVVYKNPQLVTQSLMVLYANLPDNDKSKELDFVNKVLSQQSLKKRDLLFHQALRARFGDTTSEQTLIDFVGNLWNTEYDENRDTDILKDVLLCAGTERIMQKVALGLPSERHIRLPGRVHVSERSVCENVLKEKYRDNSTFPLPKSSSYTNEEQIELRKWCEKNLKVKYPAPTPTPSAK